MVALSDLAFIEAANYSGEFRSGQPTVVTIHTPQAPELAGTAESVAGYFARGARASTHFCTDSDSAVLCVPLGHRCWGAGEGPANAESWQIELAGYAEQDRAEWLDAYSRAALVVTAAVCRDILVPMQPGIRPVRLLGGQLRAGERFGFTGHGDWHEGWPVGDYRSDPGAHFPWDVFLEMVGNAPTDDDYRRHDELVDELEDGAMRVWFDRNGDKCVLFVTDGAVWFKRQHGGRWSDELPVTFEGGTPVAAAPDATVGMVSTQFGRQFYVPGLDEGSGKPTMVEIVEAPDGHLTGVPLATAI